MPEDFDKIEELVQRAQAVRSDGTAPFVLVPDGTKLESLERFMNAPLRKKGRPTFIRYESFCQYVLEQRTDDSRLYVTSPTQFMCVLDHSSRNTPGWAQHVAILNLTMSPEWQTWKDQNKVRKSQRDFAQFIDDNATEISTPSGADLLELVRTLKMSQTLEITGNVDEDLNQKGASFVLETKTKAGAKGAIELPPAIVLGMSVYEGGIPGTISAAFRFQIQAPNLFLWYELFRPDRFERTALDDLAGAISKELEMEPWYGVPTVNQ